MTVTLTQDSSGKIAEAIAELTRSRVVVGIPGDAKLRDREPGEKGTPPTNAVIGYAMEYGLPDKNVPARPFLYPGVESVRDKIADLMKRGADKAMSGDVAAPRQCLELVGEVAMAAVQDRISDNIPPPLSERTIVGRAKRGRAKAKDYVSMRRKGASAEDLAAFSSLNLRTLVDTGQLLKSVTYQVRDR